MEPVIAIRGLGPMLDALAAYPEIIRPLLEKASRASLLSVLPDVKAYPVRQSRYVRTGTLGRRWTDNPPAFEMVSTGFEGSIGNNTEYAPLVQDADMQASYHEPYWQTAQEVLETSARQIEQYYEAAAIKACQLIEEAANG